MSKLDRILIELLIVTSAFGLAVQLIALWSACR